MLALVNSALFVVRAAPCPGMLPYHLLAWNVLPDPGEEVVEVFPYNHTEYGVVASLLHVSSGRGSADRGVRLLGEPRATPAWPRDDTLRLVAEALLRDPPWTRQACHVELFDAELPFTLVGRDVVVRLDSETGRISSRVVERLVAGSREETRVREEL